MEAALFYHSEKQLLSVFFSSVISGRQAASPQKELSDKLSHPVRKNRNLATSKLQEWKSVTRIYEIQKTTNETKKTQLCSPTDLSWKRATTRPTCRGEPRSTAGADRANTGLPHPRVNHTSDNKKSSVLKTFLQTPPSPSLWLWWGAQLHTQTAVISCSITLCTWHACDMCKSVYLSTPVCKTHSTTMDLEQNCQSLTSGDSFVNVKHHMISNL